MELNDCCSGENRTNMDNILWANELNLAITVTDINDTIIYMNEKSGLSYPNSRIGDNLAGCHKQSSMNKIDNFKKDDISNTYTVSRNGVKKFIHQTPWYKDGVIAGIVEFSIEIPSDLPHIDRD